MKKYSLRFQISPLPISSSAYTFDCPIFWYFENFYRRRGNASICSFVFFGSRWVALEILSLFTQGLLRGTPRCNWYMNKSRKSIVCSELQQIRGSSSSVRFPKLEGGVTILIVIYVLSSLYCWILSMFFCHFLVLCLPPFTLLFLCIYLSFLVGYFITYYLLLFLYFTSLLHYSI
jgi:hypothetical protein